MTSLLNNSSRVLRDYRICPHTSANSVLLQRKADNCNFVLSTSLLRSLFWPCSNLRRPNGPSFMVFWIYFSLAISVNFCTFLLSVPIHSRVILPRLFYSIILLCFPGSLQSNRLCGFVSRFLHFGFDFFYRL